MGGSAKSAGGSAKPADTPRVQDSDAAMDSAVSRIRLRLGIGGGSSEREQPRCVCVCVVCVYV